MTDHRTELQFPPRTARAGPTGFFRTPDEAFEDLTAFPFAPCYRMSGGLRLAHVDVASGPPVVMLHGQPTWSFVWRKLIPPLCDAGYRCIAPDHAGFGRSDKPTDPSWHTLDRHVELTAGLLHDFDLFDVTLVLHDWGGPIGLTLALTEPERVRRIVILDTAIDPREAWMSDAWVRMRERVEQTDDPPIAELMRSACFSDPGAEVLAAYEAPFPTAASKAGARGLAMSVPDGEHPSVAGVVDGFCDALRGTPTPMLILWAAHDPFLTLTSGRRLASRLGRRIDHVIPEAGNVLQEDQGAMIGNLIAEWLGCP